MKHLVQFCIYRHPSDFPDHYVVRPWIISDGGGVKPSPIGCLCSSLKEARGDLAEQGFIRMPPWPGEDPVIAETWI